MARPPLIGVSACVRQGKGMPVHGVSEQYIRAVSDGMGAVPVLIPALGAGTDVACLLDRVDGLLFTGSPSNVEPRQYGGPEPRPGTLADPERDATTLPLIRAAIEEGVPLLALCRGHQELNVALGGTLHAHVQELPGKRDHRAPRDEGEAVRYAPVHAIRIVPGGTLAALSGGRREAQVNSLHGQAIDRLAPGLRIEATADDGVIEAVSLPSARAFVLGVQWHPEWSVARWSEERFRLDPQPLSRAIFRAFGDAALHRANTRKDCPVGERRRTVSAAT